MAKETLPIDFKDDILDQSMNGKRRYNLIQNEDGTVSFEDVTDYSQIGSDFGQKQINQTNQAVNESADKNRIIDDLDDISANTQPGMIAGALAVGQLNKNYVINSGGEPSTGYWEKWSDGTLDMWGTQKAVTTIANNNTVPYYKPPSLIPLPVESTVPVTASLDVATGGMIWAALAAETSESQIAYRLFSGVPYSNVAIEVHWTVKGRWK